MFAVTMLPAGHGDALLVEYGTRIDPHQLLIDAGTVHSWPDVSKALRRRTRDRYEVFVVTHVDEDHIGGAVSLLDDPDMKHRVSRVWFNGYVHCDSGGNVLGPVNGEQLTDRIRHGGFCWNDGFRGRISRDVGGPVVVSPSRPLPVVDLAGGARAVILTPSPPALRAMSGKWKDAVIAAGLVPGAGDQRHTSGPGPRRKEVPPLPTVLDPAALRTLAARTARDGSPANRTSISFVLEYEGRRVLFGADATAGELVAGLARYAELVGQERPNFDLVKVAHHGSNANISPALLSLINCRRWLISTNGDTFAHPDDAAIAKLINSSCGPPVFYCNYRSHRTLPWAERAGAVGATFVLPEPGAAGLRVPVRP